MELYTGIDLHSSNGLVAIMDSSGKRIASKRLRNKPDEYLRYLKPYKENIGSVSVESTYNWYWLVDALISSGYNVKLANPGAMKQYDGLKHTDDTSDAFFLAQLDSLGILPTGYIYPKEERGMRDLMRRRMFFVQHRTSHILSLAALFMRECGHSKSLSTLNKMEKEEIQGLLGNDENLWMTAQSNMETIRFLSERIKMFEKKISGKLELRPEYEGLLTIPGVGKILAFTIMLETGDISRFPKVGNYTSYCRAVNAERYSNKKKKDENNRKNGNKYLSWAFVEAAHHFKVNCPKAASFYEKKKRKKNGAVATKALACKLTKASYFIIRDNTTFEEKKIFG